jgi:transposase
MAKELVSDELWKTIEPLLPDEAPKPKGSRPRVDNRSALAGIIFVLKSAIPWEMLPNEMGCASGVTCAGDAYASGKKPGCGRGCTKSFWSASEKPTE